MNLNDLPDEVLEQIFDHLDLYELKLASLVCRRWAKVTFSGRRMDRVWFILSDATWKTLLNIKRPYRNIHQLRLRSKAPFKRLSRFLQTLKLPVRALKVGYGLTLEELRLIVLEVPELQDLCIKFGILSDGKTNGPFLVLTKLKCLELYGYEQNQFDCFRTNVVNLQSLYMSCDTDRELEAWRHLDGQLKLVHVYQFNSTYISQFLELTFPHLEDFTIEEFWCEMTKEEDIVSSRGNDFFRRHSLLRRLSVPVPISVEWIRSITSHCPELTYLPLTLVNLEEGILDSLVQLKKLRHLSFLRHSEEYSYLNRSPYIKLDTKLFHGAIKSLESVELEMYPTRVFLENLFETAPQLNCLEIKTTDRSNLQLDIEFICEKFSCLRRLEFDMYKQTPTDNSVRIDKLEHLEELKIRNAESISFIHRNNVRCLTLSFATIKNNDLGQIPEKFPLLKRLILDSSGLFLVDVERLHKLMPSYRIDIGSYRFYPQVLP